MKKLILSLLVVVGLTANAQMFKNKKDASSVVDVNVNITLEPFVKK
jgi:hypothetical protein